jgi:hypothetical protein
MKSVTLAAAVVLIAEAGAPAYGQQIVNHCRPDGAGGFICKLEREEPKGPPPLTKERIALIRQAIRNQIPTIPYTMTPDEMTAMERYGGTASNEERIAESGSQLEVCESRLRKTGYSHFDYGEACAGLSVKAPTPEQQTAFDQQQRDKFRAALDAQRRKGEALRDKIAKERAQQRQPTGGH